MMDGTATVSGVCYFAAATGEFNSAVSSARRRAPISCASGPSSLGISSGRPRTAHCCSMPRVAAQSAGCKTYTAAEHKQRAVQHQRHVIDGVGKHARGLLQNGLRQRIASQRSVKYLRRDHIPRERGVVCGPEFLPFRPNAFAANHAFQSAGFIAFPRRVRRAGHQHITDFSSSPTCAVEQGVVQHDAGADAGSNRDKYKIARTFGSARPAFADSCQVHIVVHRRRNVQRRFEHCGQRNVAPSEQIGGCDHATFLDVGDSRYANGDGFERACAGRRSAAATF